MLLILLGIFLVALMLLPQYWVKHVLSKHNQPRDDFPGTGGDMARHLLGLMEIEKVTVETTAVGDHYDPNAKAVRLTQDKLDGKSLTGVVVAAHEVGHAIQDHKQESLFKLRSNLAILTNVFSKAAPALLLITPVLTYFNPAISRWSLFAAIGSLALGVVLNLVTLPVEWDASFGKALPILEKGQYLSPQDMKSARTILTAAAFTYVAGSLASMLNLANLVRILMRR